MFFCLNYSQLTKVMLNLLTLFNLLTLGKVQESLTMLSLNRKFQHLTASLFLSFSADRS